MEIGKYNIQIDLKADRRSKSMPAIHVTEAQSALPYVRKYLRGFGVDVGCGKLKCVPTALGIDFEAGYNRPDLLPKDRDAEVICGWETIFPLMRGESLDYIFSSGLLEDYEDSTTVLNVWCRTLKPGGYLVLYLPIEAIYRVISGAKYNQAHNANWESSQDFMDKLDPDFRDGFDVIELSDLIPESRYMFYVVLQKKVA